MKINFEKIKDKEVGKIGFVIGLGPSLNEVLTELENFSLNSRDKVSFYCSNLFNLMTNIVTDYWIVCNPQKEMHISNYYKKYNSQPNSIFMFAPRINGFSEKEAESLLTVDYIAMSDQNGGNSSLPLYLKSYTSSENSYTGVHSVIVHQLATAVITGCKEIYISGVDLDYSGGYVKKGVHKNGVKFGQVCMNKSARTDTINKIKFIKDCAKNVGCEIYSLNEKSPLSKVLEVKKIDEIKSKLINKNIII